MTETNPFVSTVRRLYWGWETTQGTIVIPLLLVPAGILAIILGEGVSSSFTIIGGGAILRLIGVLFFTGGCLKVFGVLKRNAFHEAFGAAVLAVGAALFGGGAIIGLRVHGLMSGFGFLALSLTLLGRVVLILRNTPVQDRTGTSG